MWSQVFSHQIDFKNYIMKFQGMEHKWINGELIKTSVTDFCSWSFGLYLSLQAGCNPAENPASVGSGEIWGLAGNELMQYPKYVSDTM